MNPEIKTRWVEALRSGKYSQARGALRTRENTFCCLGVLCDLAAEDGIGKWDRPAASKTGDLPFVTLSGETSEALPPFSVLRWAGLDDEDGTTVFREGEGYSLADLNDNYGVNFESIAQYIEESL